MNQNEIAQQEINESVKKIGNEIYEIGFLLASLYLQLHLKWPIDIIDRV